MKANYCWWNPEMDCDQAMSRIFELVRAWDMQYTDTQMGNLRHLRLYSARDYDAHSIASHVMQSVADAMPYSLNNIQNRIQLNVTQSAVDTLVSKITKEKVKPTFLTSGGAWEYRRRARMLNKFLFGLFYGADVFKNMVRVERNSYIFGTGFGQVYYDKNQKKICTEAIFPDEISVDPKAGYYRNPLDIYRRKFVSRAALCADYPDKEEQIKAANARNSGGSDYSDTVLIIEAWRLPYGNMPGRHVIGLDGVCLLDEEYKRHSFPMVIRRYNEMPVGFFGQGVCEILKGIQIEINRTIYSISESLRRLSKPWIFRERGSKIATGHFDNKIGSILDYTGTPPIITVARTVAPEQIEHLENMYRKAFEIIGVTQLSATGRKPSGLDAAVALREYNDIETERFAEVAKGYQEMAIDWAYKAIDLIEYELGGNFEVSAHSIDEGVEKVRWKDIRLPRGDSYVIQCYNTSAFPKEPGARLQRITEMLNAGLLEPTVAMELLDYPDLDQFTQVRLAPQRIICETIESMLFDDDARFISPDPDFDLEFGLTMGLAWYNWALLKDIPEERVEMIRQWNDQIRRMLQPPPAPPAPPGEGMGIPPGMAEAVPQGAAGQIPPDITQMVPEGPVPQQPAFANV